MTRVAVPLPLLVLLVLAALVPSAILLVSLLEAPPEVTEVPVEPEEPSTAERLELVPVGFEALPGWPEAEQAGALGAFLRSCSVFERVPAGRPVGEGALVAGHAADWLPVCAAARRLPAEDAPVRAFFERHFRPYLVTDRGNPEGLFTGYYEPTLQGSRRRTERYDVPLYVRPPELVSVDLGRFSDELAGRRLAGRVEDGRLVPFADRRAIEQGALTGRDLELLWVDDPVDAFFLHIQGSGRVELAGGGVSRIGYAGQNGHPYRSIGRLLVDRGTLTLAEVTMPRLRHWLAEHPREAAEVMRANPSYVFFRELPGEGPEGAQGVVLTPERSLAVDLAYLPLGVPLWLSAMVPGRRPGEPERPFERLLVAQDTGGAIRGPVRGDLFWGPGEEAASVAGRMKHPGRLWLLLPERLSPVGKAATGETAGR